MKGLILALMMVSSAHSMNLPLPPGTSLSGGMSCGGVPTSYYVKGFDANGNLVGETYSRLSCSTGGRGSRPHVYYFYHSITWDFFGGFVIGAYDGSPLNTATVATDAFGNVANVVNNVPILTINQMPPHAQHIAYVVPDVTGMSEAVATATLRSLTFVVVPNYFYTSSTIPAGSVFGMDSGAMLPVGSTVAISVAISCDGTNVNCD